MPIFNDAVNWKYRYLYRQVRSYSKVKTAIDIQSHRLPVTNPYQVILFLLILIFAIDFKTLSVFQIKLCKKNFKLNKLGRA